MSVGSPRKLKSALQKKKLAYPMNREMGIPMAEIAWHVGVETSAIAMAPSKRRGRKIILLVLSNAPFYGPRSSSLKVYHIVFGDFSMMESVKCLPYSILLGSQRMISGHRMNTTRANAINITYGMIPRITSLVVTPKAGSAAPRR